MGYGGREYPSSDSIFGMFADASPDRWGQILLNKRERKLADGSSYLDLVSVIKSNGANPTADLIELWKRIVFNMAVSSTDDHLRNHAFILKKNGWVLSPLYDVNPVPYGDELSLNVNENDNRISIALAIETAHRFGIKEEDAVKMAMEITEIVRDNWEKLAVKYGISRGKIEDMRPAFSACYESI